MTKYSEEQKALEDEVTTLKKEHAEKAAKCNTEWKEAHEALATPLASMRKGASAALLRVGSRRDPAVEGEDKMKYIEENKVLERELKSAKGDIERLKNKIARHEAALAKDEVGQEHWAKLVKSGKGTYEALKASLK